MIRGMLKNVRRSFGACRSLAQRWLRGQGGPRRRPPHLLFVTEKWCDGNPAAGLTNNEHNLFGSLEVAGVATYERWHPDEYLRAQNRPVDEALLQRCQAARPDAVMISYLFGSDMNLSESTLKRLSAMGIPLVFFWFDSVLEARAVFADQWAAPYAALNVMFDTAAYRTTHPDRCVHLWVPQDTRYYFNPQTPRDIDLCFLGSVQGYQDRQACLGALKAAGFEVFQGGGQREHPMPLEAYAGILQRSKICLNFSRVRGELQLSQAKGRIYEVTLCGALLLDHENDQIKNWFTPMEDYVPFQDEKDLLARVTFYLNNPKELERIARYGWTKAVTRYNPKVFWQTLLTRAGVKTAA